VKGVTGLSGVEWWGVQEGLYNNYYKIGNVALNRFSGSRAEKNWQ